MPKKSKDLKTISFEFKEYNDLPIGDYLPDFYDGRLTIYINDQKIYDSPCLVSRDRTKFLAEFLEQSPHDLKRYNGASYMSGIADFGYNLKNWRRFHRKRDELLILKDSPRRKRKRDKNSYSDSYWMNVNKISKRYTLTENSILEIIKAVDILYAHMIDLDKRTKKQD